MENLQNLMILFINKGRLMKIYKERIMFIHNGYFGYVKSRGG